MIAAPAEQVIEYELTRSDYSSALRFWQRSTRRILFGALGLWVVLSLVLTFTYQARYVVTLVSTLLWMIVIAVFLKSATWLGARTMISARGIDATVPTPLTLDQATITYGDNICVTRQPWDRFYAYEENDRWLLLHASKNQIVPLPRHLIPEQLINQVRHSLVAAGVKHRHRQISGKSILATLAIFVLIDFFPHLRIVRAVPNPLAAMASLCEEDEIGVFSNTPDGRAIFECM